MSPLELRPHAAPSGLPYVDVASPLVQASPLQVERRPESPGLSLRSNFAWVLMGNGVYAVCQWGMIVALAKLGNSLMVGQFSLGIAIATPVLMLSNFDLRAVQATDASRHYRFSEYLRLRIVTTLAALVIITGIVWFGKYERKSASVILAVALAKGVETLSDIHYGLFQLNERLDETGRSMMLRGVVSVVALSAGLRLTGDVLLGCLWLAAAWLGVLFFFDLRRGRRLVIRNEKPGPTAQDYSLQRQRRLIRLALPLGVVTTIASVNLHIPRYFIHAHMGEHQLGLFSAMAYATVAMTLVGDSLGSSAIPRMSRLYADGKLVQFRAILFKLVAVGCVIGLSGVAIVNGTGPWLLTKVYSPEYAAYSRVFVLLTAAAAIQFAASMLTSGITSARRFRIQVPMLAMVAACTAAGCARWVPTMGLAGGAFAAICGAALRLALATAVTAYLLLTPCPIKPEWRPRI